MPRFLFWNYRYDGPDKEELLARLVHDEAVDFVVLAEASTDPTELCDRLASRGRSYVAMPIPHNWVEIFAGYPAECFRGGVRDEDRLCLRRIKLPGSAEFLLGAVHLESGLYRERSERMADAIPIAIAVRQAQHEDKHSRTILVGDFNLNPFDDGMIFPKGFGAMMTKSLARRYSQPPGSARFYNPLWSRLGREVEEASPGTYYWDGHRHYNTYWNYLDQVLIGGDLLDDFSEEGFRILRSIPGPDGPVPLIREKSRHWKIEVSDHLPLIFDVALPKETDDA